MTRLPAAALTPLQREHLAVEWALRRGEAVPRSPFSLRLISLIVLGLLVGLIPGLALLAWTLYRDWLYRQNIEQLIQRWAPIYEAQRQRDGYWQAADTTV